MNELEETIKYVRDNHPDQTPFGGVFSWLVLTLFKDRVVDRLPKNYQHIKAYWNYELRRQDRERRIKR